ncbi:replication factor C subunit 5-like [Sinocyclocheilus grahami]|uniref:replication factor C subunit 5-like n=1 Tax=Sinocyclocheilus grahami TaxID=75366 RepID=UPI0007AD5F7C|nr:PREDICTED: replication factor C subunit 5-like [Sinocyclocheilus grahami]
MRVLDIIDKDLFFIIIIVKCKFISEERLPHLLFYGPPGTGKTSTILACAKQLYKDKEFNSMVLELNASDDRGIDVVRGPILSFASTRTIFKKGFKLVILDEADAMTQDAQNALRRGSVPSAPLSAHLLSPQMARWLKNKSTHMAYGKVTEETVYTCTGHPLRSDIANILDWALNKDFTTAYKQILQLKTLKGLALHDILTEVHLLIHRVDFPPSIRMGLLIKLADIEYRLASGTNEKIQLSSMLAAFQAVRDIVVSDG